jgi:hypothetical protein
MPKKQTEVDRAKLEAAILKAESGGPVAGRTALWSAVATLYNGDNPPCAITPSVVYIRFTQWGLTCKTQPGKKGSGPLSAEHKAKLAAARSGTRRSRAEVLSGVLGAEDHITKLRVMTPNQFHPLIDRIAKGSRAAAMKLQCLQCVGFERAGVRDCGGKTCPLYLYRPYQKSDDDEPEAETQEG